MKQINRRKFLIKSGKVTAGAVAGTATLTMGRRARAVPANEQLTLGAIGIGSRGMSLVQGFASRPDCQIAAICDVNQQRLNEAKDLLKRSSGHEPKAYDDPRKLLDDSTIEAVIVATPDHWHALATVWACQAGKHVYVEKPISNNPWEGRKAVEAARKYDRVVQSGLQNRSAPYCFKAKAYLDSGKLGGIHLCRVYNQKRLEPFRLGDAGIPPSYLNWDVWNGPNTDTQFHQTRYQHWHDFWCYGGGDVTNDGVHQMDLACMLLGIDTYPRSIHTAAIPWQDSDAQTPDTVVTTLQYDNLVMTFQQTLYTPYMLKTDAAVRNSDLLPHWPHDADRIEIFGTNGVMFVSRHGGGWQVFGRPKTRKPVAVAQEFGRFPDPEHKEDFVQAIREHRRPNADIEHGHRSAALCHFANISYRVGHKLLLVDGQTERFTNCEQANSLLKPRYRAPYVISDPV